MTNFLRATLLFFTTHLRRSVRSRRTFFSLAFALLPGAVAWLTASFARRISADDIATAIGWLLMLQVVLPILALVGGTAVIAEEVEDRTITYLFSRPIPRASVLLGRWLAALVVLSVVASIGTGFVLWSATRPPVALERATLHAVSTVQHASSGATENPRAAHDARATQDADTPRDGDAARDRDAAQNDGTARNARVERESLAAPGSRTLNEGIALPLLQAVLLGSLVYSALFSVAGALFKHPMIVGVAYAFVIEGFLANLPGKNQALTVQYYLRSWIVAHGSDAWNRVEGFAGSGFDTPGGAVRTLVLIWLGALAFGAWRVSRREFVLTS
jgi:hypothetical protein